MKLGFSFEIKTAEENGRIQGYASTFDNVDRGADVVEAGAFADSIAEFEKSGNFPPLLWQHDQGEPIGPITALKEDRKGLIMDADLLLELPAARKAHQLASAKLVKGLSIGFMIPKGGSLWRDDGVRTIQKVNLMEVSLVTIPMNPLAEVTAVKAAIESGELPEPKLIERILRDAGFSRRLAKAFMASGYKGLNLRDADDSLDDDQSAVEAAIKLLEAIKK